MKTEFLRLCGRVVLLLSVGAVSARSAEVIDSSPLHEKAAYLQRDLLDKHWLTAFM
ncbi:MAG TPA: hypothetical protein VNZ64_03675 [Candidatus Acidoferrum sp.]|jgi:hypothetical protein|nr:hypothetical protein [Candidatus Acidoferrum sp.]